MTPRGTRSPRDAADAGLDALRVRRATAPDLGTIVALRLALLREYPDHPVYGRLRPDVEVRARALFAAQLEADNEVVFIAELNGAAVGLLRCVETVSSPLLLPERYCYLSSAFVKPEYRRRGVLHALIEHARSWCDERGLVEIRLHNVGSREAAAGAWDALGFEVVEQVRLLRLVPRARRTGATDSARASAPSALSARSVTR
jgi:GNAT superfamily N-acetyltransferase